MAPLAAFVANNHILGFLFLGYIVLLWEGAGFAFSKNKSIRTFAIEFFTKLAAAFLPGLLLIGYAFVIAEDVSTFSGDIDMFSQRFFAVLSGLSFFNSPLSALSAMAAFAVVILALYFGLKNRVILIHREMGVVCLGVFILVLIMPTLVAGIWGLHLRYGGALLILVAASVYFPDKTRMRMGALVFGAVGALLLVNGVGHLSRVNSALQEIRAGLGILPKGAKVISAISPDIGFAIGVHAVSLAAIEADGYVPNLFTNISAVGVKPPYRAHHFPQGKPQPVEVLRAVARKALPPAENGRWSETYYYGWPAHFTHLLYVRTPSEPGADFPGMHMVASGPDYVLYEITQTEQ